MIGAKKASPAESVVAMIGSELGNVRPDWSIKSRPDGEFLLLHFAFPNERIHAVVNSVVSKLAEDNPFRSRVAVVARSKKPQNVVTIPETKMLQKELSESLTVDRNTFGDDFTSRYTASVTDYETNIIGKANYVVYGRRGSGKSSLLAYAMHDSIARSHPISWVALQTYSGRRDLNAIAHVISELLGELSSYEQDGSDLKVESVKFADVANSNDQLTASRLDRMLPRARSALSKIASKGTPVSIFLDDIHVLHESLQPKLLSAIYALTRGNNSYIKLSGIEQFTNIWDSTRREGLEPPHDAQILKLDHNLTMPDRSKRHIISILDAHATYCGLPNIAYLAEDAVLSRLVLVAAAVPRDALSLFSQAITRSSIKGQKAVTITAINAAASEAVEEKLKDIGRDTASTDADEIREMLERLRVFCVRKKNTNAFLVKIDNRSDDYKMVQKLIALRFVHVLHEGITPHKVAERYVALMLDFGFYIGIRAAKNIKLFPDTPRLLAAKELRKLPVFTSADSKLPKKAKKARPKATAASVPRKDPAS